MHTRTPAHPLFLLFPLTPPLIPPHGSDVLAPELERAAAAVAAETERLKKAEEAATAAAAASSVVAAPAESKDDAENKDGGCCGGHDHDHDHHTGGAEEDTVWWPKGSGAPDAAVKFTDVTKFAYDQSAKFVSVYIDLPTLAGKEGGEGLLSEDASVTLKLGGSRKRFDLHVQSPVKGNHYMVVPNLCQPVVRERCKVTVKADRLVIKLRKEVDGIEWSALDDLADVKKVEREKRMRGGLKDASTQELLADMYVEVWKLKKRRGNLGRRIPPSALFRVMCAVCGVRCAVCCALCCRAHTYEARGASKRESTNRTRLVDEEEYARRILH